MSASQQAADAVDFLENQDQHHRNYNDDAGHGSDDRAVRILHVRKNFKRQCPHVGRNHKQRDRDVIERSQERKQGAGQDRRTDQRQRHPPENGERVGAENRRRPFQRVIKTA